MSSRVTGKQFADNTIIQNHLNLIAPVYSYDATRKDYVDTSINNHKSIERESKLNIGMVANTGSTSIYLACNIPILEDPLYNSLTDVYLNGLEISTGLEAECYFSPDGEIIRNSNDVRIGDKLYWNYTNATYHLESNDIFDFKYITNNSQLEYITLVKDESIEITSDDKIIMLKFTGLVGETATVIITGISFSIGNVDGIFTFDIGDINGYLHTFTYIGENYTFSISGLSYSINWNGESSLLFSVITKNNSTSLYGLKTILNVNYDNYYFYTCNSNNDRIATLKNWLFLIMTKRTGVGWYDAYLFIYKKVNEEWTLTQQLYHENSYYPMFVYSDKSGNDRFILKRYRLTGSAEKAQTYILNGDTWEKETNGIDFDNLDISSAIIDGNNAVIANRIDNVGSTNDGRIWTFHYSGGTWWNSYIIDAPDLGQSFGYVAYIKDFHISTISREDNKLHTYTTTDSGLTWGNHQEITGHTQATGGTFYYYSSCQILNNKMLSIMDNNIIVMWEYVGDLSGGTWVESELNLPGIPPTGDYYLETFSFVEEDIIVVPIIVSTANLYRDEAKVHYYQKINGVWNLTILKTPYAQNRCGGHDFYHIDGSGGTYFTTWQDYNESLDDLDYYTIITECGKLTSSNNLLPRNVKPSVAGAVLIKSGTTINLIYDYTHIYNYNEENTVIRWYSYDNWVTGATLLTNYVGTTAKVDTLTNGKLIRVEINAKDENKIIDTFDTHCNKLWIYDDDNDEFSTTSLDSAIIILTIISGNIGSVSPGVYNISANINFEQSLTTTIWNFNTSNFGINLNGQPSYGAIDLNVNGNGYSNTLSDSYNGVPTVFFTQYIIGGVTFTIEKGPGWKFYD